VEGNAPLLMECYLFCQSSFTPHALREPRLHEEHGGADAGRKSIEPESIRRECNPNDPKGRKEDRMGFRMMG